MRFHPLLRVILLCEEINVILLVAVLLQFPAISQIVELYLTLVFSLKTRVRPS